MSSIDYFNSMPKLFVTSNEYLAKINPTTKEMQHYPDLFPLKQELVVMTKSDYLQMCSKLNHLISNKY